jgi:2-keto-4-pentenoate hydratase/2-oxohepta-3-ene-1,7-dioic acid hydratase in catechol pathway
MKQIKFEDSYITPSKVVCVGRNYVEHIYELGNEIPSNMVIFNKPNSAIGNKLYYFYEDTRFEGEICFVTKSNKIAGVGFGLDLTHAKIQNHLKSKGLPWERAKAFDNSAILSDFVAFDGDLSKLSMRLFINDELRQEANYDLMMYKPQTIVDEIQSFMSLKDGDIIMSGTPKGVSTYKKSDIFRGEILYDDEVIVSSSWVVD